MTTDTTHLEAALGQHFGDAYTTALSSDQPMGRRIHGVDLTQPLSTEQARLLVSLLDHYSVISFPNQGNQSFQLRTLERLANHFGAPIPHPKNYANYIEYKKNRTPLELMPKERQAATLCNAAFPEHIKCVAGADSPAVYVVTNLPGSRPDQEEQCVSGLHWHTDIEFEPVPLSTSMFYVQRAPTSRKSPIGTWVTDTRPAEGFYHPDSDPTLNQRRFDLPLNGETAYADTARAFADLPENKQRELEKTLVRRRLRVSDPGWLIPLVYVNPRTGRKSLHSPIWASRGKNIAPVTIDGMSQNEGREFLDEIECHVLQPKYRYDHVHQAGDITIWSNFSTLHNAPPAKSVINTPEDARLMYRISCKGEPSYALPRPDTDDWLSANVVPPYRSPLSG
jgi:alpha-ketoglutarate-dependent taurine dioxygenase